MGNFQRITFSRYAFVAGAILMCVGAWGDIVYLKNGQKMEGRVVSKDGTVLVEHNGTRVKVPQALVKRIEASSAGTSDGDAMESIVKMEKAGKLSEAYTAYEKYLKSLSLTPEAKEAAQGRMDDIVAREAAGIMERFSAQTASGDYAQALSQIRTERSDPTSLAGQAMALAEANILVQSAQHELDRSNPVGALKDLEQVKALHAKSPDYDAAMGYALLASSEAGRAVPFLKTAHEKVPEDAHLTGKLVIALAQSGEGLQAADLWETRTKELSASDIKDEVAGAVGRFYIAQAFTMRGEGKDEEAKASFEKGYALSPPSAVLYEDAHRFYTLTGDSAKADQMQALLDAIPLQQGKAPVQETKDTGRGKVEPVRSAASSSPAMGKSRKGSSTRTGKSSGPGNKTSGSGKKRRK